MVVGREVLVSREGYRREVEPRAGEDKMAFSFNVVCRVDPSGASQSNHDEVIVV